MASCRARGDRIARRAAGGSWMSRRNALIKSANGFIAPSAPKSKWTTPAISPGCAGNSTRKPKGFPKFRPRKRPSSKPIFNQAGRRLNMNGKTPSSRFTTGSALQTPTRKSCFPNGTRPDGKTGRRHGNSKTRRNSARLEVDLTALAGTMPKDKRLALPCPAAFSVPLSLAYPARRLDSF